MVQAIGTEARLRQAYLQQPVETVYFGGGTPSLLQVEEVSALIKTMRELFLVDENAEITLETNPDDITAERLLAWKRAGINRLSIGVQSFFEEDLQWMNRAHNAAQARDSILLAQQAGFNNITIDLIYGTPTLTDERWQQNVQTALALNIPHLSCYALTVEPKTALDKLIATQKMAPVDPEKQGRHFELLMQWLGEAGYEHYEISNFALPGKRSRHNSSYWQGKHYLGLGPSAHSFNGSSRQWNIANNALYLKSIQQGVVPFEVEVLTPEQQLNEYIMTSLRTAEGLHLPFVVQQWGAARASAIETEAAELFKNNMATLQNGSIVLNPKGRLFADGIAAQLFC